MSVFRKVARVRDARRRMQAARLAVQPPAAALLVRAHRHPLTTVGTAAGAGLVLGSLDRHPLRLPGLSSWFGGGLADALAWGIRLLAESGLTAAAGGEPDAAAAAAERGRGEPA